MTATTGRRIAFWYAIAWLVSLLVLAALYAHGEFRGLLDHVPFAAVAASWAGALGGISISLKGVYDHWVDASKHPTGKSAWNNELLLWHIGRPASGAIVGIAVFILLKAVYPSGAPSPGAMAAAAFVLGMQEKRFFGWVKQIGAMVVATPSKVPSQSSGTSSQSSGSAVQNNEDSL
jgi:hypothetical protein